jgi:hypothetical protein
MSKFLLPLIVSLPCLVALPETGRLGRVVIFIKDWLFGIGYSAEGTYYRYSFGAFSGY